MSRPRPPGATTRKPDRLVYLAELRRLVDEVMAKFDVVLGRKEVARRVEQLGVEHGKEVRR